MELRGTSGPSSKTASGVCLCVNIVLGAALVLQFIEVSLRTRLRPVHSPASPVVDASLHCPARLHEGAQLVSCIQPAGGLAIALTVLYNRVEPLSTLSLPRVDCTPGRLQTCVRSPLRPEGRQGAFDRHAGQSTTLACTAS